MRTKPGTDCTEMLQNLNRNLVIGPCVRWGESWGAARPKLMQLQGTGLCPHRTRHQDTQPPPYHLQSRYILLKQFILTYKAVIWVWKLKRIPVFFLMTCNRSSHGCHLSTSVLFLVRPARGAGAQLHHSTWARETGSSRVQRPTWSMSSHPATATTGDPISEGLQLLRCDNSLQFHRYSTWSFQKEHSRTPL